MSVVAEEAAFRRKFVTTPVEQLREKVEDEIGGILADGDLPGDSFSAYRALVQVAETYRAVNNFDRVEPDSERAEAFAKIIWASREDE